jgi:hypothetical protein
MDAIGRFVADAVLGTDTLWGGDVMCPSGTGRPIADSWFSDEPLPAAYGAPAAARVRASGQRRVSLYRDPSALPNDILVVSNNRHALVRHLRAVSTIC